MTDHKTQSDYFISSFRNRRAEKNRSRGTSGMLNTSSYTPPFYIEKPPWDHKIVGHRAVAQRGDCTSVSLTSRSDSTLIETSSSQNTRPTAESHAMPQYWKVSTKAAWLKTSFSLPYSLCHCDQWAYPEDGVSSIRRPMGQGGSLQHYS